MQILGEKLEMWLALASGVWQAEECPSAHVSSPGLCFRCAPCVQVEAVSGVRLGEPEDASQRGALCPPSGSGLPAVGRNLGCHVLPHLLCRSKKMQEFRKTEKGGEKPLPRRGSAASE